MSHHLLFLIMEIEAIVDRLWQPSHRLSSVQEIISSSKSGTEGSDPKGAQICRGEG